MPRAAQPRQDAFQGAGGDRLRRLLQLPFDMLVDVLLDFVAVQRLRPAQVAADLVQVVIQPFAGALAQFDHGYASPFNPSAPVFILTQHSFMRVRMPAPFSVSR